MSNIVVIGAGAWGSALAQTACVAGNRVTLIARRERVAEEINTTHTNSQYLGGQILAGGIISACDYDSLGEADLAILAVPAQLSRKLLGKIPQNLKQNLPVVVTAKGFETSTLALQTQVLKDQWEAAIPLVLSGPSFAVDVAGGKPTAVTLAGGDVTLLEKVAQLLASNSFRPYLSSDPLGVELCGGLKNVYALASGAIEGAGLGLSARSAFVSRALVEMSRMVMALGGQQASVLGLAGTGDMVLSCTSTQSRNYRFGVALGAGKSTAQILEQGHDLAEGVTTAGVAKALAQKASIEAPLVQAVNQLLNGEVGIGQIVDVLMTRSLKSEG